MLGPLKFGLKSENAIVVPVRGAAAPVTTTTFTISGGSSSILLDNVSIVGPAGAFIKLSNSSGNFSLTCTATTTLANPATLLSSLAYSKTLTITASTTLTYIRISSKQLTSISGALPSNLTGLSFSGSSLLTSFPGYPAKLVSLDVSGCSALTSLGKLPTSLTTLYVENSGLTTLDLTGTGISVLNLPSTMYTNLQYLKITGSKLVLSGLLDYSGPTGSNWILY